MRLIVAGIVLVLLSGCAAIGKSDFACKGMPEGKRCTSTHDLYEDSNGGEVPRGEHDAKAKNGRDPESSPSGGKGARADNNRTGDPVIDTFVAPNLPDRPVPIRTPSQVMRIWVASWEDTASGALIAPGYIYTEIEPRRWVIGKPESAATQQGRLFKPLEQSSATQSTTNRK